MTARPGVMAVPELTRTKKGHELGHTQRARHGQLNKPESSVAGIL